MNFLLVSLPVSMAAEDEIIPLSKFVSAARLYAVAYCLLYILLLGSISPIRLIDKIITAIFLM